jgi:hypothetical protein
VPLLADPSAEIASVAVWQIDVEDDRIEPSLRGAKMLGRFIQGGSFDRLENSAGRNLIGQNLPERVVIFND